MLTKGTAHRGLKRDEIIRRKNLRVNQNYAQSKIVRVPHLFGSRLRIPLICGCPTPVARFWRRGGRNPLEPGGRNKRSPGRECWVSVLNKPESRSRGPRQAPLLRLLGWRDGTSKQQHGASCWRDSCAVLPDSSRLLQLTQDSCPGLRSCRPSGCSRENVETACCDMKTESPSKQEPLWWHT